MYQLTPFTVSGSPHLPNGAPNVLGRSQAPIDFPPFPSPPRLAALMPSGEVGQGVSMVSSSMPTMLPPGK